MHEKKVEREINLFVFSLLVILMPLYYLVSVQEFEIYVVTMLFIIFALSEFMRALERVERISNKQYILLSIIFTLMFAFIIRYFVTETSIIVIGTSFSYLTYLLMFDPIKYGGIINKISDNLAIRQGLRLWIIFSTALIGSAIINFGIVIFILKYTSYDVGILLKGFAPSVFFILMFILSNLLKIDVFIAKETKSSNYIDEK